MMPSDYNRLSIDNLKELFSFASAHRERVFLLIRNHDMSYLIKGFDASRKDYENEQELHDLFTQHKELLQGCKIIENSIFTHAGICSEWYTELLLEHSQLEPNEIEKNINLAIEHNWNNIQEASHMRGGEKTYAGPLWMDYRELLKGIVVCLDNYQYQIFGHTQQNTMGGIVSADNWASIDSRAVFELDPKRPLETLKVYTPENC